MKKSTIAATLFVALSAAGPSAAQASYYCSGNVTNLMIGPSGVITASITSATSNLNNVYFCVLGTNTTWGAGVTAEACKGVYTALLAALSMNRPVRMYFNDNLSCTTHPAWANLTGWYNGPEFY